MKMHFYNDIPASLGMLVRHLWYVDNPQLLQLDQLLLPMDHIDLLLCDGREFLYQAGEGALAITGSHFHGLRHQAVHLQRIPPGLTIGISFTPWGFQHFAGGRMNRFRDRIVPLKELPFPWVYAIEDALGQDLAIPEKLRHIIATLAGASELTAQECRAFGELAMVLESFADGISYTDGPPGQIKHTQRLFNQYIGLPPKEFFCLCRFEQASKAVLKGETSTLDAAFANDFCDQSHLIREFKKFTGISPNRLQVEKPSLKSHLKYD